MTTHKIKTSKSATVSTSYFAECSCGWYASGTITDNYTRTVRLVKEDLQFQATDHLEEMENNN